MYHISKELDMNSCYIYTGTYTDFHFCHIWLPHCHKFFYGRAM